MPTLTLAENNRSLRIRLQRFLRDLHYNVHSVNDGNQALQAILKSPPDLVLLDLKMPKLSGLEVLQRLRTKGSAVPVLVLAEVAEAGQHAVKCGASGYLEKPFQLEELRDRLNRVLTAVKNTGSLEESSASRAPLKVRLGELHDATTGRIDASKVAEFLGVKLTELSRALEAKYTTVHKTPTSPALQEALAPIKRSLEILDEVIGDPAAIRAWLNSKHPDLGMRTPLQTILEGRAGALSRLLENAIMGLPT